MLWIAAHTPGKLRRDQVADASVERAVAQVLYPDVPLALRITAHLLTGIVRVHAKQAVYLQQDCNDALLSLRQAFRAEDAMPWGSAGGTPAAAGKRERSAVARYEPSGGVRSGRGRKRRSSGAAGGVNTPPTRAGGLTHEEIEGALASQELSLTPLGTPREAMGGAATTPASRRGGAASITLAEDDTGALRFGEHGAISVVGGGDLAMMEDRIATGTVGEGLLEAAEEALYPPAEGEGEESPEVFRSRPDQGPSPGGFAGLALSPADMDAGASPEEVERFRSAATPGSGGVGALDDITNASPASLAGGNKSVGRLSLDEAGELPSPELPELGQVLFGDEVDDGYAGGGDEDDRHAEGDAAAEKEAGEGIHSFAQAVIGGMEAAERKRRLSVDEPHFDEVTEISAEQMRDQLADTSDTLRVVYRARDVDPNDMTREELLLDRLEKEGLPGLLRGPSTLRVSERTRKVFNENLKGLMATVDLGGRRRQARKRKQKEDGTGAGSSRQARAKARGGRLRKVAADAAAEDAIAGERGEEEAEEAAEDDGFVGGGDDDGFDGPDNSGFVEDDIVDYGYGYDADADDVAPGTPGTPAARVELPNLEAESPVVARRRSSTSGGASSPESNGAGDREWTSRTHKVASYLKATFKRQGAEGVDAPQVIMHEALEGKGRKQRARFFYESLMLKTQGFCGMHQAEHYAPIALTPTARMMDNPLPRVVSV